MSKSKILYISDLHFGHKNILTYDERPFYTVSEMDNTLIRNWNEVVKDKDVVYILGDVSWYDSEKTRDILRQLNGRKRLIIGNHDSVSAKLTDCFEEIAPYAEIIDGNAKVILSHYPIMFWNGQHRHSIHLYGHVHDTQEEVFTKMWRNEMREKTELPIRMYNVGCMKPYMDYTPRTLQYIIKHGG